jgi:serine/threonine-protein kinase RsbW
VPHQAPIPREVHTSVSLPFDREAIERAEKALLEAVAAFHYPEASRFALRLAFEEAVMNAFRHGHRGLPPATPVRLSWSVTRDRASIEVEDQGPGFDYAGVPDPTLDENLERPTGRGLMLMRAYMTDVRYNDRGNTVTMVFDRTIGETRKRV